MTWTYRQSTGELSQSGTSIGHGYAGTGKGRNNPTMQHVKRTGPLPRGIYTIGEAYKHPHLGPLCMNLEPDAGNQMFGRSLFRIHGDNAAGDASLGCIVMGPSIRKLIAKSPDRKLVVVE